MHKVNASDGVHKHISEVKTDAALKYSRAEVVAGLARGESWKTKGSDGSQATIKKITYCPAAACLLTPYITTAPDHTKDNNLDNLPTY